MSRKLLVTLIIILFLFPFVSWYYLKRGLDWRKEAQKLMQGTDPFPNGWWMDASGKSFSGDHLEGHVTLITLPPCDNLDATAGLLQKFYDQFRETKKAKYILLDTCGSGALFSDDSKSNWHILLCRDTNALCDSLLIDWPKGKTHALVDRHRTIRSYYSSGTDEENRILLEHMALLLPRERSEKVELKRGQKR